MDDIAAWQEGFQHGGIAYLRDRVPEVRRIEEFPGFSEVCLHHTHNLRSNTPQIKGIVLLEYSMRAPDLFPAVRQRLLEAGLGKEHNFLSTSVSSRGCIDEEYRVHMGFYGNCLQFGLKIRQ